MHGDTLSGSTFSVDLGKYQVETLQDVSGLGAPEGSGEDKPSGANAHMWRLPNKGRGEIVIRRGVGKSQQLTDWLKQSAKQVKSDGARQDISIVMHDGNKRPIRRFHLANAFAAEYQPSNSGPATETVTLTYDEIKISET